MQCSCYCSYGRYPIFYLARDGRLIHNFFLLGMGGQFQQPHAALQEQEVVSALGTTSQSIQSVLWYTVHLKTVVPAPGTTSRSVQSLLWYTVHSSGPYHKTVSGIPAP